jgi:hypothetical protein
MAIRFHHHALERMHERGISHDEVETTIEHGERFPAKFGRSGFRRNFSFHGQWRGKDYNTKQVEAYAIQEGANWLVITVIARYF